MGLSPRHHSAQSRINYSTYLSLTRSWQLRRSRRSLRLRDVFLLPVVGMRGRDIFPISLGPSSKATGQPEARVMPEWGLCCCRTNLPQTQRQKATHFLSLGVCGSGIQEWVRRGPRSFAQGLAGLKSRSPSAGWGCSFISGSESSAECTGCWQNLVSYRWRTKAPFSLLAVSRGLLSAPQVPPPAAEVIRSMAHLLQG